MLYLVLKNMNMNYQHYFYYFSNNNFFLYYLAQGFVTACQRSTSGAVWNRQLLGQMGIVFSIQSHLPSATMKMTPIFWNSGLLWRAAFTSSSSLTRYDMRVQHYYKCADLVVYPVYFMFYFYYNMQTYLFSEQFIWSLNFLSSFMFSCDLVFVKLYLRFYQSFTKELNPAG